MDRRSFVAAMGSALLLPACAGNGARSNGSLNRIGLQLYTVRDQMEVSVERCLRDVARIGFREVEFAGYFGRPPRSIRQLLDRNGLKSPSAHVSFETLTSGWFRTLDQAAEIGHKWLVVPSLAESERNSIDALMRTAERLNRAAEDAETFDIGVAYHNHDFEFEDVEGRRIFDVLLEETDPEAVKFELDIYWAVKAGADPLEYFNRWPGRFPLLHLKDSSGAPDHRMTAVGKGTIDFASILGARGAAGVEHCYVEHDNPGDSLASAATSFRWLDAAEF